MAATITGPAPGAQTIFVTAVSSKGPLPKGLSADVSAELSARAAQHPDAEGAQDLIIAAPDGVLYHVSSRVWQDSSHKVEKWPELITTLYEAGTTLAYIPESAPDLKGCYLVNAAAINVEPHSLATLRPEVSLFRLEKTTWESFEFRPGNSVLILDMLNKGATVAYVPRSARTTDCMCYLINLATLNGSTIFEMDHDASQVASCEIPAKRSAW
jgi:hypothetical protein